MYKHFLITRFNVKNNEWSIDKNKTLVNDNIWLEDRFHLFDQFCFPSVHSNILKSEFVWLVFFDINTPLSFRQRIKNYQIKFPQFRPVFIGNMSHLQSAIKKEIVSEVNSDTKYIITTRVDNDDSLHQDAMFSIYDFIHKNDITSGLIDLTRGLCIQTDPYLQVRTCIYYSSPFISCVESFTGYDQLKTVMHRPHHKWFSRLPTYELDEKPLWIQLIHTKNMANQMQGRLETKLNVLDGFVLGYDLSNPSYSMVTVFLSNFIMYPIYRVKKVLKKVFLHFDAWRESEPLT